MSTSRLPLVALLAFAGCATSPPGRGLVALARVNFILSFTQGVAFFFPSQPEPAPIGPCSFRRTSGQPTDAGVPGLASAGPVTFAGLQIPLTLVPDGNHGYAGQAQGRTFEAGDAITISAVGADVPPFSADLTAPAKVATQAPNSLSRGGDTTITWTPDGRARQFRVFVLGTSGILDCSFDPNRGTATVPAEALDQFDPGDKVQLVPATADSRTLELTGWRVEALVVQADDYTSGTL